jgi:hypothetical protein
VRGIEIVLPSGTDPAAVPELVEAECKSFGLTRRLLGTLKTIPGSMHWHFARGRERGTLEVTWVATGRRLWFTVQDGRKAPWIDDAIPSLKAALERTPAGLHR